MNAPPLKQVNSRHTLALEILSKGHFKVRQVMLKMSVDVHSHAEIEILAHSFVNRNSSVSHYKARPRERLSDIWIRPHTAEASR